MPTDLMPPVGLEPHKFTTGELWGALADVKIELCDGKIGCDKQTQRKLLMALLANVGLNETVTLAPRGLWMRALGRWLEEEDIVAGV